jgi:hypothetical protein
VTYSATDADGNTGTASRTVIVEHTEQVKLTVPAPVPATSSKFGKSVAVSGDYAIVGAYGTERAYIFHRTAGTNTWDAGTKIVAPDAASGDFFGWSVAISGDYAIVGANWNGDAGARSGSAYIFRRTGTNAWDAGQKILASDDEGGDFFGVSVGISGDYAIVGADSDDDPNINSTNSGSAYIFRRTGTNSWDAGTKITSPNATSYYYFGQSVAISGDYAIVGSGQGNAARIFRRTGTNSWDAGTNITSSDGGLNGRFGKSVAISGDYVIVGEDQYQAAHIFRRTGTNTWDAGTKIVYPNGISNSLFGWSVAISGNTAIVGEHYNNHAGTRSGAAYIFSRTGTNTWDAGTMIIASDAAGIDEFGYSVSISGNTVIVGAHLNDDVVQDSGSAYIFTTTP